MSSSLYSGVSGLALGAGLYRSVSGLWSGASGLIAGFDGGNPYSGASLYLDFLTMTAPTFDPRITFSRGSNATLVDSTGKITYAPANLLVRSEEFDNASWTKNNVTITADATTSPNGSLTAEKFVASATSGYHLVSASVTTTAATYTYSAYFKAAEYSKAMLSNGTNGTWAAAFDLSAGTTVGTFGPAVLSSAIANAGNGWYRCSVTFTATAAAISHSAGGYPSSGATLGGYGAQYTGDGTSGVYLWGAQLEQVTYQTTPSAYVATTSAAYYGPRFDHDPVTLAARGLLIEEARTNLLVYSAQFDNAAWTKTATTVTANATASPDGTTTADKLLSTAATTQMSADGSVSVTSGTSYALSVFAKASEYTLVQLRFNNAVFGNAEYATFNLATGEISQSSGSGHTIVNMGNGWYRCTIIGAATATATGVPAIQLATSPTGGRNPSITGDGTSGIYVWGAQLEAGAFATSYISTVASTVTRSADVATMTGTNFSSWYNQSEGTFVTDADSYLVDTTARTILTAYASGTPGNNLKAVNATQRQFQVNLGGAGQADLDAGEPVSNQPFKLAARYGTNDFAASVNGGAVATDTAGSVPTVNTMALGASEFDVNRLNGHIRELVYFNTRQSNTRLQTLTAPPLVTTLSLDFTSGTYLVGY